MEVLKTLTPSLVVLGFYPLTIRIADFFGGPDIPPFIMFVWSLILAITVVRMHIRVSKFKG